MRWRFPSRMTTSTSSHADCSFIISIPAQALVFARETLRVARRAVLISDLIRSRLHLLLGYAGLPLFRSPITWHDAPASIRAAYTRDEVRAMLAGCGAREIEIGAHYLYRMGVILWK